MPIVRFVNHPEYTDTKLRALAVAAQQAFIKAKVPGITQTERIHVVSNGAQLLAGDRTLVVIVEGLFDTPERTDAIRNDLASRIAKACKGNLPPDWQVEVLVYRFNPQVDAYASAA